MTISVLQSLATQVTAGTANTSQAVTLTGVTAGSSIHVFLFYRDAAVVVTVADSQNGSYPATVDIIADTTDTNNALQTHFDNSAGGTLVITATFATQVHDTAIWAVEVGGTSGAGAFDGHAGIDQHTAPGTGTDAITVGPPSPNNANAPALVVALSADATFSSPLAPVPGTGFTDKGSDWTNSGNAIARLESKRITAAAAAATWTASTNKQNHPYLNLMAVYDESGASPVPSGAVAAAVAPPVAKHRPRMPSRRR
jgi:hypothetical protein